MNILMKEINEAMHDLAESEGNIEARFVFPPQFTGFRGHFPDRPVLPGVCKIQAVIAMLEKFHGKKICLKEVLLAKFIAPVSVNQEIFIASMKLYKTSGETKIKASVTSNDKKIAELQLKLMVI